MKILLLGSGGREHALAWKIAQSPKVEKLYIAPGNAGTSNVGTNVDIDMRYSFTSLKEFVLCEGIDMVVVGPEEPLVKGIYDYFKENELLRNIPVIGPSKAGAVLEGARNLPKGSCNAIRYPLLHTKALQPTIWKRDWLFWKHWKLLMY